MIKRLVCILLATINLSTATPAATRTDTAQVINGDVITSDGNFWEYIGLKDGFYSVEFDTNGTQSIFDDLIVTITKE